MKGSSERLLKNTNHIIELLATTGMLTTANIAEELKLSRTTTHRMLETLTAGGLVEQQPNGEVALSARWLRLADVSRRDIPGATGVQQALENVVEATGLTAYFSVLYRDQMLCIDWVQGSGIDLLNYRPGSLLPARRGAAGKVLAAYSEPDELRRDPELASIRQRGYAVSEEDVTPGIAAVGVPIFARNGPVQGALSVGGLAGHVLDRNPELASVLLKQSKTIR